MFEIICEIWKWQIILWCTYVSWTTISQAVCGKCGCAEKPGLRNLIDVSEEVGGRCTRNSSVNRKAARRVVVSRGMCQRTNEDSRIKKLRISPLPRDPSYARRWCFSRCFCFTMLSYMTEYEILMYPYLKIHDNTIFNIQNCFLLNTVFASIYFTTN